MNAAVSLSLNFPYEYLKPYLKSFDQNVNGELYLITDHTPQTIPFLTDKIHLVNFFDLAKKYKVASLTPYNLKPVLFYLFLKELKSTGKYTNALLSDVDVIFQADPFARYINEFKTGLVLGEEKHPYKDCETNSIWYKQGYGLYYDSIKDKKILNCGVTIGDINKLIDYQKKVVSELAVVLARQNYFAYDQVILNHLTYITQDLKFNILPHLNDFIVHLSQVDDVNEDIGLWIKDNKIFNPATNTPFTVVHQFDKKLKLKKFITEKYD